MLAPTYSVPGKGPARRPGREDLGGQVEATQRALE
jgi:hypothetical protein